MTEPGPRCPARHAPHAQAEPRFAGATEGFAEGTTQPQQIAKKATNRRPSPPGQPEKAVVNLRLLLPRPIVERSSARAIRERVQLAAVVEEILEGMPESASLTGAC